MPIFSRAIFSKNVHLQSLCDTKLVPVGIHKVRGLAVTWPKRLCSANKRFRCTRLVQPVVHIESTQLSSLSAQKNFTRFARLMGLTAIFWFRQMPSNQTGVTDGCGHPSIAIERVLGQMRSVVSNESSAQRQNDRTIIFCSEVAF